jgi:hypothetical protein
VAADPRGAERGHLDRGRPRPGGHRARPPRPWPALDQAARRARPAGPRPPSILAAADQLDAVAAVDQAGAEPGQHDHGRRRPGRHRARPPRPRCASRRGRHRGMRCCAWLRAAGREQPRRQKTRGAARWSDTHVWVDPRGQGTEVGFPAIDRHKAGQKALSGCDSGRVPRAECRSVRECDSARDGAAHIPGGNVDPWRPKPAHRGQCAASPT